MYNFIIRILIAKIRTLDIAKADKTQSVIGDV